MSWYFKVLRQYVDFRGRARRKEFFLYYLFHFLFLFLLFIIGVIATELLDEQINLTLMAPFYAVGTLLPSVAVTIRRLQDTGRSALALLIFFIPLIGPLWLFILTCMKGNDRDNSFGPNPRTDSSLDKFIQEFG